MKGLISIIVPTYNSEAFLDRCIQSILSQTYKHWELLLVDDGSTDTSGDICDSYAAKDDRIHVFHQNNAGVSTARNIGLEKATGEYVAFCDSDDWVDNDWLKTMYINAAENDCDIVYCDAKHHHPNNKTHIVHSPTVEEPYDRISFLKTYLCKGYALWVMMVKNDLIKKYNIRGIDGYVFCEDLYLAIMLILPAKSVKHISCTLYNYNCNNINSLVATQKNPEKIRRNMQEGINVIDKLITIFKQQNLYNELEEQLAWSMLKAKVGWIFMKDKRKEYLALYPEYDKYIHTNPLTSRRQKKLQVIMKYPTLWWTIDLMNYFWSIRKKITH